MKQSYIYIITNKINSVLYIGVTSNLIRRIQEHKEGKIAGFSQKYNLNKLVYYEIHETILQAIEREKFLKGKKREFKEDLINSINKDWIDLSENISL